ncbi:FAD-dependent oxidoreductase [Paraburkholderia oxyphila]|uniref:FAD-dependent oxidoreductase n=1 Tax=Paraburkholderia oxyphila TaxID=614212 RepID=UPI0009FFE728|nr:NAD(P)/FAD-dependent oxidoreductase [Paraburkholderia oxyphila]
MTRIVVSRALAIGATLQKVLVPWLLLFGRLWFGQSLFVHQIMTMATAHHALQSANPTLYVPSSVDAALHGIAPLLLAAGLLTRPTSLVLVILSEFHGLQGVGLYPEGAKLILLTWLVVFGPGALSLDALLRRGAGEIPLAPVRLVRNLYAWIGRYIPAGFLILVRIGAAAGLASAMLPVLQDGSGFPASGMAWLAALCACCIASGFMTRIFSGVAAAMIPLAGIAMSMDDRFAVLLIFLLLSAEGPGPFSLDALLIWIVSRLVPPEDDAISGDAPHIVVVGGGFGGVAVVQGLRHERCRITLIDRNNHHLFQPLLYQVATAALSAPQIATPIRSLFRNQPNVQVRLGEVTGVDVQAQEVVLGASRIRYDYLVLATGARHGYFGRDDWARSAPGLKSIPDAMSIRSRILRAFEEAENTGDEADRQACLTFVIVGGGPTGIELAGAIAELARHGLEQEYRSVDPSAARVILLQSGPRVLPAFPASLSEAAAQSLRALGVEVCLETKVTAVDASGVVAGDRYIPARTTLWAAGVTGSPAARWLGAPADASGRLIVGSDLSVPGLQNIYAIGDTALTLSWHGKPAPGLAPAAKQQGRYVARVITARIRRLRSPLPFQYRHLGSLATIGRQAAVADVGGIRISGAMAWWFWGAAHIAFLVGGRNRFAVILDWLWAYLTYRHSSRLITTTSSENDL